MIKVIDNFLSNENFEWFLNFATKQAPYWAGSKDKKDTIPTGMVSNVKLDSEPVQWFKDKLNFDNLKVCEAYINCFAPGENPYFHTDRKDGITVLYYINDHYSYQDGGETQFLVDDEIRGVLPLPNRMVYFDANIKHRATSYRNRHRFTFALKYGKLNERPLPWSGEN